MAFGDRRSRSQQSGDTDFSWLSDNNELEDLLSGVPAGSPQAQSITDQYRSELIRRLTSYGYQMSPEDAASFADLQIQAGGDTPSGPAYQAFLDKYDPNRGYDNNFISRTLGTPLAPLALAGVGYGLGTFGAEAAGGAGGAAAAGGAMDMFGSAGVGSALGGEATMSAAELAALSGAGTGAGETFGMTGLEGMTGAGGLGPAGGASGPLAGATMGGGMGGPAIGGLAGGGPGVLGGVGGSVAAGSALSRIIDGTGTTADWTQVLGTAGATALGMYSANQQGDRLQNLAQQNRAERQPFLSAATNYLDPKQWIAGPGAEFTKGTLQSLSGTHGNPAGSPYAQQLATDASMRNWLGGVNTLGSLGLGGQGINAQLGAGAAGAYGDVYSNLAGGVSDVVNPKTSIPYKPGSLEDMILKGQPNYIYKMT